MKIKPKWQIKMSISRVREHSLLYRDDKLGIQCEVHTTVRKGSGGPGAERFCKGRNYFFIDGDKQTFRTEAALIQALSAWRHNENPVQVYPL